MIQFLISFFLPFLEWIVFLCLLSSYTVPLSSRFQPETMHGVDHGCCGVDCKSLREPFVVWPMWGTTWICIQTYPAIITQALVPVDHCFQDPIIFFFLIFPRFWIHVLSNYFLHVDKLVCLRNIRHQSSLATVSWVRYWILISKWCSSRMSSLFSKLHSACLHMCHSGSCSIGCVLHTSTLLGCRWSFLCLWWLGTFLCIVSNLLWFNYDF